MAEYVQVPVSLPTREQIAAEVKRVTHVWSGPSMDEFINDPPTRKQYAIADAVLALLSQPTPTAEHVEDWTDAQPNEGPGCSCGFNGSFEDCAAWRSASAEPPRIEDMAPGTTFRADTIATRYGSRWTVLPSGRVGSGMGIGHEASEIDPSTIRDVTPPKE